MTQQIYSQASSGGVNKNDTHAGNPLSSSYLKEQAAKKGIDLVAIERHNRYKYGVKKPANRWKHEMDDSRISGAQIRLNDFKGTIFDQVAGENQAHPAAGIPLKR